jgi:phospholipase C
MDGEIIRILYAALLTLFIAVAPARGESKFSHVVIIVQENRSPDNLFGSNPDFEPGVDIRASGLNSIGQTVRFTPGASGWLLRLGPQPCILRDGVQEWSDGRRGQGES